MDLLVAIDGSEASNRAIEHAAKIVDATDGTMTLVHAVHPQLFDEGGLGPVSGFMDADRRLVAESLDDAEERGNTLLENAAHFAERLGHKPASELLYGDPIQAIPEFSEGFDGIFVGHRGRSPRTAKVVGSVAKAIVERAPIPVTVVR